MELQVGLQNQTESSASSDDGDVFAGQFKKGRKDAQAEFRAISQAGNHCDWHDASELSSRRPAGWSPTLNWTSSLKPIFASSLAHC